jgi:hypothetical protein
MCDADAELEPPARNLIQIGAVLSELVDRLRIDRRYGGGEWIRISGDFWTRVWSSIFRPRFDRRLPYGADEAGAQATAQSERIKA